MPCVKRKTQITSLPFRLEGDVNIDRPHRIKSQPMAYAENIYISEEIQDWINKTRNKYKVDLYVG